MSIIVERAIRRAGGPAVRSLSACRWVCFVMRNGSRWRNPLARANSATRGIGRTHSFSQDATHRDRIARREQALAAIRLNVTIDRRPREGGPDDPRPYDSGRGTDGGARPGTPAAPALTETRHLPSRPGPRQRDAAKDPENPESRLRGAGQVRAALATAEPTPGAEPRPRA